MQYSNFFRLDWKDFGRGLSLAVLTVVVGAIHQALTAHGYDFASYDWGGILDLAWKTASLYLGKNLLSTENGKVLGRIG